MTLASVGPQYPKTPRDNALRAARPDLPLSCQVYVPLLAHCVRPQVSEDRPGGHPGLGMQSARALQSLALGEHDGINAVLAALLTPGGLAVLRRSPEELVRVLRSPVDIETPRLVWGPKCREQLDELLKQVRRRYVFTCT